MFRNTHRSRPAALRRTHAGQPPGQPFSGSRPARRPAKCSGTPQTRAPARQAGQPLSLDPTPGLPPPHPAHQRRPVRRFNPVRPFGTSPARAAPCLSTRARRAVPYLCGLHSSPSRQAAPSRLSPGGLPLGGQRHAVRPGRSFPAHHRAPRGGSVAPPRPPVLRYARRVARPRASPSPSGAGEPFDSAPCGASRPPASARGLGFQPRRAPSPICAHHGNVWAWSFVLLRTRAGCLPGTAVPGSPAFGHPRGAAGVAYSFNSAAHQNRSGRISVRVIRIASVHNSPTVVSDHVAAARPP